jgi:hypothetical protein
MPHATVTSISREPMAYEALPIGTVLNPGMPITYKGLLAKVADKGCCRSAPVLVRDGKRMCMSCGPRWDLTPGDGQLTIGSGGIECH